MKRIITALAICLAMVIASPVYAHHAAQGTVDDEIWLMIDEMVADTPHATMVLDLDAETGMWEMDITAPSVRSLETMLDGGLLIYLDMLDDVESIELVFNDDNSVTMTVTTVEEPPTPTGGM